MRCIYVVFIKEYKLLHVICLRILIVRNKRNGICNMHEHKESNSISQTPCIPLKTILENFLNHVDTLETKKREGDDAYDKEFQNLKNFSDNLKNQIEFVSIEGENDVNRKKNRYKDILPFDYTRVTLSEYPGVPGSDYINANFIKGASGSNAYIASQGPLPHTVNDFWRMVVECEVQVIVMACNEQEAGKHKCERYWSEKEGDTPGEGGDGTSEKQFGKFFVRLLKSRQICPDFLVRTLRLRWTPEDAGGGVTKDEERTVCQFHYSAWPDHGIPVQVKPLLEMVRLIRDCQASETLPVLIHCSAGCGRTGTICAIDFIWGLLRTGKLTSDFSLFNLVRDMRKQRIAMVQTVDQYILVHRSIRELFLEQLRVIDSHPYENVDETGHPVVLRANDDNVTPDYETVFVKNNEELDGPDSVNENTVNHDDETYTSSTLDDGQREMSKQEGGYIESVLVQKLQPRTVVMGTAMLNSRNAATCSPSNVSYLSDGEEDDRRDASSPPENNKSVVRFKKGHLRLTKTKNGAWKLREFEENPTSETIPLNEDRTDENGVEMWKNEGFEKLSEGKSVPLEKCNRNDQILLRRPSIKKMRAFFNQNKEKIVLGKSLSCQDDQLSDTRLDSSELLEAMSKLPSFSSHRINVSSTTTSLDRQPLKSTQSESRQQPPVSSCNTSLASVAIKRSKSMKSVIPLYETMEAKREQPSVSLEKVHSNYETYPKASRGQKLTYSVAINQPMGGLSSGCRRNSFRRAVVERSNDYYESIWFEKRHQLTTMQNEELSSNFFVTQSSSSQHSSSTNGYEPILFQENAVKLYRNEVMTTRYPPPYKLPPAPKNEGHYPCDDNFVSVTSTNGYSHKMYSASGLTVKPATSLVTGRQIPIGVDLDAVEADLRGRKENDTHYQQSLRQSSKLIDASFRIGTTVDKCRDSVEFVRNSTETLLRGPNKIVSTQPESKYCYPRRSNVRPMGPREPSRLFQRKQEYL